MKFWKNLFKEDIFDLKYQELVENPNSQIKKILNFCELAWDENCLKHENNSKSIKTASLAQARKPIYKSAIKSSEPYKQYLNKLVKNIEY